MRCGVSEKTINNVIKKNIKDYPDISRYKVPVFTCQLAHDSAKHQKKLVGEKMGEWALFGGILVLSGSIGRAIIKIKLRQIG